MTPELSEDRPAPWLWLAMLLAAAAGGMGWGIRGQYGHETGAMIAGVLVGFVVVLLFCPRASSLFAARAVAFCALGVSIGGSMTYGQTVGLTHDAPLIGNHEALRWGLLGLFIKGGIWIGTAAGFLAMALSATRYRPIEFALLPVSMIFLFFLGHELLNTPFDPANRELPAVYFSDDWHWEPAGELEPRHERWGGLLFALAGLYVYAGFLRGDRLVRWLVPWGVAGGGIGFSAGQSVQAFHAWNKDLFSEGLLGDATAHFNWWNMMETTFGLIFGAVLALGLWIHRRHISDSQPIDEPEITTAAEWLLVAVHMAALVAWNFLSFRYFDLFADLAISMVIIPAIAVSAGRAWPYLVTLPIVAVPIAGKTLREMSYDHQEMSLASGWGLLVVLPLLVATAVALVSARGATNPSGSARFARWSLFTATWLYFGLNLVFFRFPWPWEAWTGRTPNAIIFFVCAVLLTTAALFCGRGEPREPQPEASAPSPEPAS